MASEQTTLPLRSEDKESFINRDESLPIAEQIRKTRADVYDHVTPLRNLSAGMDTVIVRLDGLESRMANLEASMDTQQEQLKSLADMSERILRHLEQPLHVPTNQNGSNGA
ncbi:hypothetical protein HOY82DRAFT_619875 [Tuber indicum]|nr:hypothetical protein HOY82DRAFT_619875 [Tuber indicum]